MTDNDRQEIKKEIEVAELFIKDLEKIWKSYAKKALEAKQERESRQAKKGFLEYENVEELIDAYGYGDVDQNTYERGLIYFELSNVPPSLSVIEKYRNELKELINIKKGTVTELKEELEPATKKVEENAFEKIEREEREERQRYLVFQDAVSRGR